ncbi:hypothetical protein ACFQH8_07240 [Halomicroarcula sp. GCM10025710]
MSSKLCAVVRTPSRVGFSDGGGSMVASDWGAVGSLTSNSSIPLGPPVPSSSANVSLPTPSSIASSSTVT